MTHLGAVFGHHKNNSYGWWPTHYCCHHGVTRLKKNAMVTFSKFYYYQLTLC